MYDAISGACERLLRIPPKPGPPPGDEASAQVFRAAPRYYQYLLALWGLGSLIWLFAIAPILILSLGGMVHPGRDSSAGTALLVILSVLVVTLVVAFRLFQLVVLKLDFDKRWYVVTDRSLRIREGVIKVSEMTVRFANIQNLSISQGPIQRALGIADLRVDTAGGGSMPEGNKMAHSMHTAWFRGIANATEIRELIQVRVRHQKDSGIGDPDGKSPGAPTETSGAMVTVLREILAEATALGKAASR